MKFETGKQYWCRSICDYDCVFTFTVTKRTAKTVWLKSAMSERKRRIHTSDDGTEWCEPHGQYSMSPSLHADKVAA